MLGYCELHMDKYIYLLYMWYMFGTLCCECGFVAFAKFLAPHRVLARHQGPDRSHFSQLASSQPAGYTTCPFSYRMYICNMLYMYSTCKISA